MPNPENLFDVPDGWYEAERGSMPEIKYALWIVGKFAVAFAQPQKRCYLEFEEHDFESIARVCGRVYTFDGYPLGPKRFREGWNPASFDFLGKLTPIISEVPCEWAEHFEVDP